MFTTPLMASGACYLIKTACSCLCSEPPRVEGRVEGIFNRVRLYFAQTRDSFRAWMGERHWETWGVIVYENLWITILVYWTLFEMMQPLLLPLPADINITLKYLFAYAFPLLTAARCATIREEFAQNLPALSRLLATWISPRVIIEQ